MRLSREKVNKLSHLVTEELVRLDNLEFIEDRNTIRLEIVKILNEELKKEERDNCEVVAGQTSRRQADEEADGRTNHDNERDRHETRQVDAIVIRTEERIGVGTDSEERDVTQIEQATPADDDVEPEREQHVHGDVERDPPDVAAIGDHGNE